MILETILLASTALAFGVDDPSTISFFHGTKNLRDVLESGLLRPSMTREPAPTIELAVARRKAIYEKWVPDEEMLRRVGEEEENFDGIIEESMETALTIWESECLVPMFGRSYGTLTPETARFYAGVSGKRVKIPDNHAVLAVRPLAPATVAPDEDWVGDILVAFPDVFPRWHGDTGSQFLVRNKGPDFERWLARFAAAMSDDLVHRLAQGCDEVCEEITSGGGYDMVALRAVIGKMVISDLSAHDEGRLLLAESLRYADRFSAEGPLQILSVVAGPGQ